MSREILFRGKRTDNGEWVEGYYFVFRDKSYITNIEQTFMSTYYTEESIVDFNLRAYEAEPSTVCQYTGLTDKNGRKIWENDIVRASYGVTGIVKFGKYGDMNTDYGFYIKWDKTQPYWRNDICYWQQDIEVIGNIFDNPELLEVANG